MFVLRSCFSFAVTTPATVVMKLAAHCRHMGAIKTMSCKTSHLHTQCHIDRTEHTCLTHAHMDTDKLSKLVQPAE